ncbi:MAG TPA: VCBS repeat-containing protein, partial [Chitinophagaceae bacterium]|nr:VCBS repeat-containing protein [Chitinophagaceae bacterium]
MVIADWNGDGKTDLAVTNSLGNSITVYRNTGTNDLAFATEVTLATGFSPRGLHAADIDGDGRPELVSANFFSRNISVFRNSSTGTAISFLPANSFATSAISDGPYSVTSGDVDGDGKPDLALAGHGEVHVLKNESTPGVIR